jgi:PhnB protein
MASDGGNLPKNTSIIIPRLVCRDPAVEIDFCVRVFEGTELNRRPGRDGSVAHALLSIGGEMVMIEAEWPTLPSRAPAADGTSPVVIFVYVPDVDQTVERASACGGKVLVPVQNQFWGDRTACIMDPSGHVWTVATRIEETTAEERTGRWEQIVSQKPAQ